MINLSKLKKMLCTLDKCTGYLYPSINIDRDPVYRCKDCHNWITETDYNVQLIGYKEYKNRDEVDNLRTLNEIQ